jgi:hypothetical protein
MTPIRQKTGNYCFVACVASALLDEGYDKLQDLIVDRFPTELRKESPDNSGIPEEFTDVEAVITGLNLAVSVTRWVLAPHDARGFLLENKHMARWIFIATTPTCTHCVRLREIRDDGGTSMEPADCNFNDRTWAQFNEQYRALIRLKW